MTLPELCLRRPVLTIVASALIALAGAAALLRLPVRELPNVDATEVTVSVAYTGASAAVIDAEVTTVLEGAIASVAGVETISSESELGSNRTVITFAAGRDIDAAANDVRAAVQRVAPDLPAAADAPEIEKNDTESEPVMRLTLSSDSLSRPALTDLADRRIVDRLSTLPGVANVQLYGERLYAMRVWLDPQAMAARDVTVADVSAALRDANLALPAGEIASGSRRFVVRSETRLADISAFETLVIAERPGGRVQLRDVATVSLGVENDTSIFRANGAAGVGLGVLRQSQSNVMAISEAVRAEVERLREALPETVELTISSDDALFIEASIREVLKTLGFAVALVVAVILLFLSSARAAVTPAVVIPISLLGACAGLWAAGFSINVLTLFALILAVGLVVDDAIVVEENVQRRIEGGEDPLAASALGAGQVTFAVIATSLTLIAVFVPLSFLQGEVGRLFSEFGLALAMAVIASTVVALTLVPVLCATLLPAEPRPNRVGQAVDGAFRRLAGGYRAALTRALAAPAIILAMAGLVTGGAAALWQGLPGALTPDEDRGLFYVSLSAPAGSALSYTDRATRQVEAILEPYRDDGVLDAVTSIVGRYDERSRAITFASLVPWGERETTPREILEEIRPQLDGILMADIRASAPSGLGVGGGATPIEAKLTGPSFEDVADWSGRLADALRDRSALSGIEREYEPNQPGFDVRLDRGRAAEIGVDARQAAEAIQAFFASAEVGEFIDRDRQYPVLLEATASASDAPEDLRQVWVRAGSGDLVPLDGLVHVTERASVRAYNRFNRQPVVEVSAALGDGADLSAGIEAVREEAEALPAGAAIAWDGQARQYLEASSGAAVTFGIALLLVFLVLAAQFESFLLPVVILLSTPLAAAGALLALWVSGLPLTIYAQVGLVLLIGLMAKNGILIVEFANQLRDAGRDARDAALEAAETRLRPILMTALSTILGAAPLVFSTGAGAESRLAIGVVIIGGFALATTLTLFLTPTLYALLAPLTRPRGAAAARLDDLLGRERAEA